MIKQEIKNIKTDPKTIRNFGLILSGILTLFSAISFWKGGQVYQFLFPVAVVIFFSAIFFTKALKYLYFPWMVVATLIGWTITNLILTVFYFLVITPIAVTAKLLGKDLLKQKIDPQAKSYWVLREKATFSKEDFEHQF
ncbi:MAG: hypothetical protein D6813_05890 [Calditrichaeota bacterium]|nr:MAG: hypothetical protein D6813_05890 [Calditrichota bacterium]